jgi:hypothetical protein
LQARARVRRRPPVRRDENAAQLGGPKSSSPRSANRVSSTGVDSTRRGWYSPPSRWLPGAEAPRNPRFGVCDTFGEKARLQGLALLESPLPPVSGLDRLGGPMLSWVFNLSRVFPFAVSGRCCHRPSSHRLGRVRRPSRSDAPCGSSSEEVLPAASQSLRERRSWPISRKIDIPS